MLILSSSDLMALFDVRSPGTLTKWKSLGAGIAAVGRNKWDAARFLEWWLTNIFDGACVETDSSLSEARRDYWKAKSERERLAADREKGTLIPVVEVESEWVGRIRLVTSGLESFADRLAALLVNKSRNEVHALLKSEVRELRLAYARDGKYTPEVVSDGCTKA